jgi:hypothetical protein
MHAQHPLYHDAMWLCRPLSIPVSSKPTGNAPVASTAKPPAKSVSPPVTPAAAALAAVRRISHDTLP